MRTCSQGSCSHESTQKPPELSGWSVEKSDRTLNSEAAFCGPEHGKCTQENEVRKKKNNIKEEEERKEKADGEEEKEKLFKKKKKREEKEERTKTRSRGQDIGEDVQKKAEEGKKKEGRRVGEEGKE